jgi:hypothetical protein
MNAFCIGLRDPNNEQITLYWNLQFHAFHVENKENCTRRIGGERLGAMRMDRLFVEILREVNGPAF